MSRKKHALSQFPAGLLALALTLVLVVPAVAQNPVPANPLSEPPSVRGAEVVDRISPFIFDGDLRHLPAAPSWRPGHPIREIPRHHYREGRDVRPPKPRIDPLLRRQEQAPPARPGYFDVPWDRIPGQGYSGVNPPDTVGDVGADYYIQMINDSAGATFVIYDKTDGSTVAGPITLDSLGSGNCASGYGDPIVLYDHLAGRWMLSEFSSSGNRLCVYISQSGDPVSGGWYNYDFTAPNFPDYPKYAVWPDAYYVTSNESGGPAIYALERAEMLNGNTAEMQRFTASSLAGFGFQALTPADLDGPAPAAGSVAYIMRHRDDEAHNSGSNNPSQDYLEIFEFDVDWVNSSNSTFTGPTAIAVTEFDSSLCGLTSFSCIPQPGTSTQLDPLREVVMWRAVYRNFSSYEALVGSLATDVNGSDRAGVRWFELRRTGGAWSLYQEGTYSPDSDGRFMSSTAMDGDGNLATGYNVSSSSTYPSLRYAGRYANDPLGTLPQGENSLVAGSASNSSNRYGDYSSLNVDPIDECTFWFTGEYNTSSSWSTWISWFSFDGCGGSDCGNNVREGSEVCDGSDLGGQTCVSQGCTGGGTLACSGDCGSFDLTACLNCGNNLPVVTITAPANGSSHIVGDPITFTATADDVEDGDLSASLDWTSSIDGAIGSGASFSTSSLSLGDHTITAEVTDSGYGVGSDSIVITVAEETCDGLVENFEGTLTGWTMTGLWHVVDDSGCASPEPGYNSPTHSAYYGQDSSCDYNTGAATSGSLTSPELTGITASSTLTFQYLREVESYSGDYDRTQVNIVTGSGSTTVFSLNSSDASNPVWTLANTIDLSAYEGETIQIEFVFNSVDSVDNDQIGWMIDDVVVTGECGGCTSDPECNDGLYCNGAETCNLGTGQCEAGTPVTCDDGVACTDDSCNESTDSCDYTANDANCANGLYCDGTETCDQVLGCQAGTAVDCNDGVGCTDDSCNEGTDQCDNVTNDASCADGLYCNGVETCDAVLDCQTGSDPCPGQSCDEVGDVCIDCTDDPDCDDGLFCNGAETCVGGSCQAGSDPCPGQSCDEAGDQCIIGPQAQLEWGTVSVGATAVTVNLTNTYTSPVVVTAIQYSANTAPVVTRISNVTANSFDIRLQLATAGSPVADTVSYLVVEEGTWNVGGVAIEAQTYTSTVTDENNSWVGEAQTYGQSYTTPVVLGQVMSENDAAWSVFWDQGTARTSPPSAAALETGKTVCEDTATSRADEVVGFVVIEAGHGTLGGVEYEAALGADSIRGIDNTPPFAYTFSSAFASAPTVAVVTMAGMDGGNGGWAQVHGATMATTTTLNLSIDEDQIGDSERKHTTEQVGYVVFAGAGVYP